MRKKARSIEFGGNGFVALPEPMTVSVNGDLKTACPKTARVTRLAKVSLIGVRITNLGLCVLIADPQHPKENRCALHVKHLQNLDEEDLVELQRIATEHSVTALSVGFSSH